jgi:diguanylate cyclase (GGDEF)-like protein/PAS domain S-box-containing protein
MLTKSWFHPIYHVDLHKVGIKLLILALIFLFVWQIPMPEGMRGIAGYEPLHTFFETFSIIVSVLIFAVIWNALTSAENRVLLFVACSFMGIAILDFSHMLSIKGMPTYITASGPEKAINFWLSARLMAAITLLLIAIKLGKPLRFNPGRYMLLSFVLCIVALLHWIFLFHDDWLPRTFIAGQGLTTFKRNAEYIIIGINLLSIYILLLRMRKVLPFNAPAMMGALCVTAMSEFFFTLYGNVTDIFLVVGHLYKIIAYMFLYQAVFVEAIAQPFNEIKKLKSMLVRTQELAVMGSWEFNLANSTLTWSDEVYRIFELNPQEFPATYETFLLHVHPEDRDKVDKAYSDSIRNGSNEYEIEHRIVCHRSGKVKFVHEKCSHFKNAVGKVTHSVGMVHDITDRHNAENLFHYAVEASTNAMIMINALGNIVLSNVQTSLMFGYAKSELTGQHINTLLPTRYHPQHHSFVAEFVDNQTESRQMGTGRNLYGLHHDGHEFSVEIGLNPIKIAEENYVIASIIDNTERDLAEEQLLVATATFETNEGILVTDAHANIVRVNNAFQEITGYSQEEVVGKNPRILSSGRHDPDFYQGMWHQLLKIGTWSGELWNKRKNGTIFPIWLSITAIINTTGKVVKYVAVFNDLSKRKQAEEDIRDLAFYDPLTRLPNRRLLMDRLSVALSLSDRSLNYGAVLFIDMDNFKLLNDTLGHDVGDLLLIEAAARIQACVREVDTVARLGGDEFVVLLEDVDQDDKAASQKIALIAEKIRAALSESYHLGNHLQHSSPSIGASLYLGTEKTIEQLLKSADIAMYQAKDAGRNVVRFFDPNMQQAVEARASLEADLRLALSAEQFQLHYQIQMDSDLNPLGAEALLRWTHPLRGMVSPLQFIPIAEESRLIIEIGGWVLHTACRQLGQWAENDLTRKLILAVNVSAEQFMQSDFVAIVAAELKKALFDPSRLKLELTESVVLTDVKDVVSKMHELKALGIRLSLDDFGTGYSSLSYLKQLPLDQLKIDQSFVRDMISEPNDAVMVKTIIDMAKNFRLNVIAEGVETEAQMLFLKQMGCMSYQGYYFSKPVPIEQFENLLSLNQARTAFSPKTE